MRAKTIHENISDLLTSKSRENIFKDMYKGPGQYILILEISGNKLSSDSFSLQHLVISSQDELEDFYEHYEHNFKDVEYKLSLFKIDSTKNFSINFYPSSGISVSLLTPIIYKKEFNEKN